MKRITVNKPLITLLLTVMLAVSPVLHATPCEWPDWTLFKQRFLDESGRVIDHSDPRQITTSEGQSYGLFFALVAGDQKAFRQILRWTETHLAQGDLGDHLPAWLWGRDPKGHMQILDPNSAADSDLWIAYSLKEAGRLWNIRDYQSQSALMLQKIVQKEVSNLPQLGPMLLPGRIGFTHPDYWTLNPSYVPPFILENLATSYPDSRWPAIRKAANTLLMQSSPHGFAPDWVNWTKQQQWQAKTGSSWLGSYDAIRVYLWVGMLNPDAPEFTTLIAHFQPMVNYVSEHQKPPEKIDIQSLQVSGNPPVGFSAALLPLLKQSNANKALAEQHQYVANTPLATEGYYNSALTLFGLGWLENRYAFSPQGELILQGRAACQD
ncbi:MAG: cellulose synthase complex periplasmic endoglucanase BcsZ [Plesiomonas sp.]|uniref:cellulose synthase complex periplasmic endoglucanase BcsZ n=1 Tax=Plesiomonas sp. TaxID=2486279 RepID=UPI003F395F43